LADCASLPRELDLFHTPTRPEPHLKVDLVPAGRIIAMDPDSFPWDLPEVSGPLGVVEEDLLVEFFKFGVHVPGFLPRHPGRTSFLVSRKPAA
jgi:hypothetical protein